jgi:hypothetical protein
MTTCGRVREGAVGTSTFPLRFNRCSCVSVRIVECTSYFEWSSTRIGGAGRCGHIVTVRPPGAVARLSLDCLSRSALAPMRLRCDESCVKKKRESMLIATIAGTVARSSPGGRGSMPRDRPRARRPVGVRSVGPARAACAGPPSLYLYKNQPCQCDEETRAGRPVTGSQAPHPAAFRLRWLT